MKSISERSLQNINLFVLNLTADNRGALRELEGLEKLVEFVGNKVCSEIIIIIICHSQTH